MNGSPVNGQRAARTLRQRLARTERRGADLVFALLLVACVLLSGWLIARHDHYWDWTGAGRNSLSAESAGVLAGLGEGLRITVYAPHEHAIARAVDQLLMRYRQLRPDIHVEYVDPGLFPERARDADVRLLGQIALDYHGRHEALGVLSETRLTNAIARLSLEHRPWIAVLEGHGERQIAGAAGPDIGRFAQQLVQRGFRLQPLDLASHATIPDNTDLLLVTTPAIALFPGEVETLKAFVEAGGNLLWLMDPGEPLGLGPLAQLLGIEPLPGQLVDADGSRIQLESPTVALVAHWPAHPLFEGLDQPALFPGSLAFSNRAAADWLLDAELTTGSLSWNETGAIRGRISREERAGERPGPLSLAMLLVRPAPGDDRREQRVIVVGDGDFLSNAHVDNGANQALGLRMVQWLAGRENLVRIAPRPSDTDALALTPWRGWAIAGGAVLGLPALLLLTGVLVRARRGRETGED